MQLFHHGRGNFRRIRSTRYTISIGPTGHTEGEVVDTAAEVIASAEEAIDSVTTVNSLPFVDQDHEEATVEPGYWSKYHTGEERRQSLNNFRQQHYFTTGQAATPQDFQIFLNDFEGEEETEVLDSNNRHKSTLMLADITIEDNRHKGFLTELGEVDGIRIISILNDQSAYHFFTKDDIFQQRQANGQAIKVFTLDNRYSSDTFQGIIPDTGASSVSSASEPQFRALYKLDPRVRLDTSRAREHRIKFRVGDPKVSLGTADVDTPIRSITFHILPTNTPFLFYLKDIDTIGVELRNKKNVLERGNKRVPIVRKSPGRFKFTLKDNYKFNYSVIVDILYLEGKPVLQIDTYQGPPDYVVHDTGKNFTSTEFKQLALSMSIKVKEVPVEAHNSVGKVERYHTLLRRAYEILRDKLKDKNIDKEIILQMAVKAVNDSAGPDRIIPTLLVFRAYPRITEIDPPSPSVIKRAKAIRAATKEVRRLHTERQVNNALAIRNGPSTIATLNLPLQSDIRV
ncbi:uncharacterized protein N7473_004304 [Penicillium subrubescens]|nr:uncharacterized protein N7473_004304 [Penicillium subrubescens]KAJ5900234.1 hypothetical protein N7473_004304 [Penicillium subrubescens]